MARYMSNSDVMSLFEDIDNIKVDSNLSEADKSNKIFAIQDKMIKGLSFLVYSATKRYRKFSNYEDLTQEGFIGLLRAIRKFNRNLFPNFFVYSERWIRHSVSKAASRFDIVYSPSRQRVVYSDHSGLGEDELVDSPEEEFIEKEKVRVVRNVLSNFCDRDREIVERVFGINTNNPQTLRNIGPNYNLTHERIRQIKNQVIEKLKGSEELGKLY